MEEHTPNIISLLISTVTTIVELLLSLRIILKLFGANPAAPFVDWAYQTTAPLLNPFEGMFPAPALEGGFVIEFSALFALLVYVFVGYLLNSTVIKLAAITKAE